MTLTEFLEARITEDEADTEGPCGCKITTDATRPWIPGGIHGWSCPARVLAECAAKRAIIEHVADDDSQAEMFGTDVVPRMLALPYADHPDYQEAWRL